MSELLYTQEDIDEWIRTCEELQERNRELKQEIAEYKDKIEQGTPIELKELKKAFWQYIGRHGIVVTNGNIDFVVEDCLKELQNGRN